ncbi:MAG TPA: YceH family protein [Pyrinomonadaceae bacterium]|nr:YceH family protein [Pyrinomonadaceae bacterium]
MAEHLNEIEARVLGSLVEKQLTTPEYYPLTLNALTAACNQKSNRDPVVSYSDETVTSAVDSLRDKNLVYLYYGSSSRVVKYKHMLPNVYDLSPPEVAAICVMLLRGPQTVGELRERTGRLFEFSNVAEVNETLDALMRRDEPLVVKLERQPGQKEARYAHLLSGEVTQAAIAAAPPNITRGDRIGELESKVEVMQGELAALRAMFDEFRKQFE